MTLFNDITTVESFKFSELLETYFNLREEMREVYKKDITLGEEMAPKIKKDCDLILIEMDMRIDKAEQMERISV